MKMDRFFWRQFFIMISVSLFAMSAALVLAFPGILNPSLLAPNSTDITATRAEASWIAASNAVGGVPCLIILPLIMQRFGRKAVYFTLNITMIGGWIILLVAKNITALYFARIVQGTAIGYAIISSVVASEYCSPKRRGYFMAISKGSMAVAVLFIHVNSLYLSWRQICGIFILLNISSFISTCFWPESPAFLAMNGKFEECRNSFTWLHGNSEESQKELSDLIAAQAIKLTINRAKLRRKVVHIFLERDFQLALLISTLLIILKESIGRHIIMSYVIQIMMELVKNKSIATYYSMGADCLIILAFCLAGFVIRIFNRRTLLFTFGAASVMLMGIISLIMFLKSNSMMPINSWWVVGMIMVFIFVSHVGVLPSIFPLLGEVFTLEHRGMGVAISGVCFSCVYGITLKLSPFLIEKCGLQGLFMVYGICTLFCLIALYFLLPETKDKTLQNIEIEMKGLKELSTESQPMLA